MRSRYLLPQCSSSTPRVAPAAALSASLVYVAKWRPRPRTGSPCATPAQCVWEDRLSKGPPPKSGGRENLAPCSLSHWEKWNQLIPVRGSTFHPMRLLEAAACLHMARVCRQLLVERAHIIANML